MGLGERPKHVNFTNIMYQSEQSPLYIHFGFGPQREAVHPVLATSVIRPNLGGKTNRKGLSAGELLTKTPKNLADEASSQHRLR